MKEKNYGQYFTREWIIPSSLGGHENEGLIIKISPEKYRPYVCWNWGSMVLYRTVQIYDKKDSLVMDQVDLEGFLKLLTLCGVSADGKRLNGTFKLIQDGSKNFQLIPEGSGEEKVKMEITNIYNSPSKFTSKWIPNHLYISKRSKNLYLYLEEVDIYSTHPFSFEYSPVFSENPTKAKAVIHLDRLTYSELERGLISKWEDLGSILFKRSDFLGKDLGEVSLYNNESYPGIRALIEDCIIKSKKNTYTYYCSANKLLCNKEWEKSSIIREEIKRRLTSSNGLARLDEQTKAFLKSLET